MLPTPEIPVFCANKYEFQNDTTSVEFIFTSSKGRDQLLSHVGLGDGQIYLVSSISQVFYKEASWNTQAPVLCLKYLSQKLLAVGHPNGITLWGGPANLKLNFPTPFSPVSIIERCNTDTIVCCSGANIHLYRISTDEQGIPTLTPSFSLSHNDEPIALIPTGINNGSILVAVTKFEVYIWNILEGKLLYRDVAAKQSVYGKITVASYIPKENLFLLGYECGFVEFLALLSNGINVTDTLSLQSSPGEPVSALKSNSSILLVGRASGAIDVIERKTLTLKFKVPAHTGAIKHLTIVGGCLYSLGADNMLKCWSPAKKAIPPQMKNEELLVLPISTTVKPVDDISISTSVREFDREGDLLFEGFNFDLMSSASTTKVLQLKQNNSLMEDQSRNLAQYIIRLLQNFQKIENYSNEYGMPSHQWLSMEAKGEFISYLPELCKIAMEVIKKDDMLLQLTSPAYVWGDLHGSYKDLEFFSASLWKLGIDFTPSKYIFLGDFVDRGPHSVEVIGCLFALKVLHPTQVFLIRGNHEFTEQNGKIENKHSFIRQCYSAYGHDDLKSSDGETLWYLFNKAFEWLPLACIIDRKIFCCHGGIPRLNSVDVLYRIANIQRPLQGCDLDKDSSLALDLLWTDVCPSELDAELSTNESSGFGINDARGPNIKMFGSKALNIFFQHTGCTHIIRAHQPQQLGIHLSKTARCITIFSSSHYCGSYNSAAVVFIDGNKIQAAITSHTQRK